MNIAKVKNDPKSGWSVWINEFLCCRHADVKAAAYCANKMNQAIDEEIYHEGLVVHRADETHE